ncbi:proto-oncogene tyrosine-protein kinase Yrk-like [Lethenteron reissneri]|uniref:proto-oncogene tyrosine-protein kinase Yrk-like n=1 Tax=Lethenteron reissneri TaxID=7753 RepID=UPI002AB62B08|nr:proto-oncogene tyrosine-protein kinase Yrk-like [Lethenteron reissneri]
MEGAVPCDYCLGGSAAAAAAVKTCLTCLTSFCEEHLRPHKENALLRTHQLIEATRNVAEKLCPTHARVLDFFCEREQRPLCHECSLGSEHRTHRHTALEETCRAKRVLVEARVRLVDNTSGLLQQETATLSEDHTKIVNLSDRYSSKLSRAFDEARTKLSRQEEEVMEELRNEAQRALSPIEAAMEEHVSGIARLCRVKDSLQALLASEVDPLSFLKMLKDQDLNESLQTGGAFRRSENIDTTLKLIVERAISSLNSVTEGLPTDRPVSTPPPSNSDVAPAPIPMVPQTSFTVQDLLKIGAFTDIHRGLYENRQVAIKIRKDGITNEQLLEEGRMMGALRHERLINLLAMVSESPASLIMEFMSNGNLLTFLERRSSANRDRLYLKMAAEVAEGMRFLEEEGCVHLDLRAANILLDDGFGCKIAGFQLVRKLAGEVYHISEGDMLPARWCAIETFTTKVWTCKCDSWSFGVLLFEIYSDGALPYRGMTHRQMVELLMQGTRLTRPRLCHDAVHSIMASCWHEDPHTRPDFGEMSTSLSSLIGA